MQVRKQSLSLPTTTWWLAWNASPQHQHWKIVLAVAWANKLEEPFIQKARDRAQVDLSSWYILTSVAQCQNKLWVVARTS
jgi:hypothetical protein